MNSIVTIPGNNVSINPTHFSSVNRFENNLPGQLTFSGAQSSAHSEPRRDPENDGDRIPRALAVGVATATVAFLAFVGISNSVTIHNNADPVSDFVFDGCAEGEPARLIGSSEEVDESSLPRVFIQTKEQRTDDGKFYEGHDITVKDCEENIILQLDVDEEGEVTLIEANGISELDTFFSSRIRFTHDGKQYEIDRGEISVNKVEVGKEL